MAHLPLDKDTIIACMLFSHTAEQRRLQLHTRNTCPSLPAGSCSSSTAISGGHQRESVGGGLEGANKPNSLKDVDAGKLQLFLAKKDDAWLDGAGAQALTLDAQGHLQGFVQMDPMLTIKNPKHFGEEFSPNEGDVHVLVVVPETASETSTSAQTAKRIREIHEVVVQNKRKRYVDSKLNWTECRQLLLDLNIRVELVRTVPFAAGEGTPVDPFKWGNFSAECGQEIELTVEKQRERYREYVEHNISDVLEEKELCVVGVGKDQDILNVKVEGRDIELSGHPDLLVLSTVVKQTPDSVMYLPEVKMLIDVQREITWDSDSQALSELLALDLLVDDPVMALLTDLDGYWAFFWVSKEENGSACIHKATIKKPGEAFEVMRTLLAQSPIDDTEIKHPCFEKPVKRQKLSHVQRERGRIRECIEQYYDVASMLGPDVEMAHAVAKQIVRSIPAFSDCT